MEVKLEHVTKKLKGHDILQDINMTFESGRVYGLKGYNGSGKTMLLRMVSGLIRPTEGKVYIDGRELGKEIDYPASVGLLIENPAFPEEFTGEENLKMLMALKGTVNKKRILECLQKVGLDNSGNVRYKKYSLGMKQRLGIAAAIMEEAELILLDEPTNALDAKGIQMIVEIVNELRGGSRLILIASHELQFLENIADIICEMDNGRLRRAGEQ